MSEKAPDRTGWILPMLLAVTTTAALGFGFLYLARPNAGELGAIRVVVADDNGKTGNSIRVVIAEAPLIQKKTVSPGTAYTGAVHYPAPYLTKPNLKLTSGRRNYQVAAETGLGFSWFASPLRDDFREDIKKDANLFDKFFGESLELQAAKGNLKPGLIFEEFTWEAEGLRMPPSSLPPQIFEQTGRFYSALGQDGPVNFPVPYDTPPKVEFSGSGWVRGATILVECTARGFKWKNVGKNQTVEHGELTWTSKGVRGGAEPK